MVWKLFVIFFCINFFKVILNSFSLFHLQHWVFFLFQKKFNFFCVSLNIDHLVIYLIFRNDYFLKMISKSHKNHFLLILLMNVNIIMLFSIFFFFFVFCFSSENKSLSSHYFKGIFFEVEEFSRHFCWEKSIFYYVPGLLFCSKFYTYLKRSIITKWKYIKSQKC